MQKLTSLAENAKPALLSSIEEEEDDLDALEVLDV
jgi:hypothetical protein